MALPDLVRLAAVHRVDRFCEHRVPAHAHDQVRLESVVRGNSITLVERRAPWHPDYGPEWSSLEIAQLRYDPAAHEWSLYCRDRNERWFPYAEVATSPDVAPLLDAVDADPTGIFWG